MSRRPPRPTEDARDFDAWVLSVADSRDDRVLRLLTAHDELVPALARGIRRTTRKPARNAVLQPLTRVGVRLSGRPNAELALIDDAVILDEASAIKTDLARLGAASIMAEAIIHLVPDHAGEDGLFDLFTKAMGRLATATEQGALDLACLFLLRLLDLSGLLPDLDTIPETLNPNDPLNGLLPLSRQHLSDWRAGRWTPLPLQVQRPTLLWLERQVTAVSLRPLKSQGFVDALATLPPSPPAAPPPASPRHISDTPPAHVPAPDNTRDRNK
jgi:recombinational DNA repair protein (RecF pathway)